MGCRQGTAATRWWWRLSKADGAPLPRLGALGVCAVDRRGRELPHERRDLLPARWREGTRHGRPGPAMGERQRVTRHGRNSARHLARATARATRRRPPGRPRPATPRKRHASPRPSPTLRPSSRRPPPCARRRRPYRLPLRGPCGSPFLPPAPIVHATFAGERRPRLQNLPGPGPMDPTFSPTGTCPSTIARRPRRCGDGCSPSLIGSTPGGRASRGPGRPGQSVMARGRAALPRQRGSCHASRTLCPSLCEHAHGSAHDRLACLSCGRRRRRHIKCSSPRVR